MVKYDYRLLREIINANHDRFSELNYDTSLSLPQKMNGMVEWFKVMLQEYNDWVDYLDDFKEKFDDELYATTEEILDKWEADGLFDQIINERLFSDLVDLINNVDERLSEQMANLSPTVFGETYGTLAALKAAHPTGAEGIFIVANENAWYFWNGTAWARGNELPNSISPYSLSIDKLAFVSNGSVNMFNKATAESGGLGTLGTVVPNPNFITSYYIRIDRIAEIKTSSNVQSYATYDVDKNLIVAHLGAAISAFTPEANTRYIRVTLPVTRLDEFMVVYGELPATYQPYADVIGSDYIGQLENKNIKDKALTREKMSYYEPGNNLFDQSKTIYGQYLNPDNNNLIANPAYNTTPWIPITGGQTRITVTSARTIGFRNNLGVQIGPGIVLTANPSPYTMTVPAGATQFALSYQIKYQEAMMVNYGETLLGYQKFGYTDKDLFISSANIIDAAGVDIELPPTISKLNASEIEIFSSQIDYANEIDYTNNVLTLTGVRLTANDVPSLNVVKYDGRTEITRKVVNIANKPLVQGNKTILMIGDSYINGRGAAKMVEGVGFLLGVTPIGTLTSTTGVANEGRSGWTSSDYRKDTVKNGFTNPFYYSVTNDFNFTNYCNVNSYDPTHVIFNLGINDVFAARNDSDFEASLATLLGNLNFINTNVKSFNSAIKVYFNLIPLPNANKVKFIEAYASQQSYDRYCKTVYMTNKALMSSGLSIIPTNIVVDPVNGMLDAIHPTDNTYYTAMAKTIAATIL